VSRSRTHRVTTALRLTVAAGLFTLALAALTAAGASAATNAATPGGHVVSTLAHELALNPHTQIGNTNCGSMGFSPPSAAYGGEQLTLSMDWTATTSTSGCQMLNNTCYSVDFGDCNAGYWVIGVFCSTLAAEDLSNAEEDCDLNNIVVLTDDNSGPDNSGYSGTSYNTCTTVRDLESVVEFFGASVPGTVQCVTDGSDSDGWSENWPTGSDTGTANGPVEETGSGTSFSPADTSVDCPPSATNIAAGAIPNTCAFVVLPATFEYYCFFGCVPDVSDTNDGVSLDTSDFLATFFQYQYAPSFTSPDSATVQAGTPLNFQISTNASPAATVTASGSLPQGVTFSLQGNGAAELTGTPANSSAGTYLITLNAGNGVSPDATQQFTLTVTPPSPEVSTLSPETGPAGGGTTVEIEGAYLDGATGVSFGQTPAASFQQVSSDEVTAVSPPGSGTVTVSVTNPYGTSDESIGFTYIPVPTIADGGLAPSSGPAGGGTTVAITGTGLTGTSQVTFGGTVATGVTVVSSTEVTAVTPAGSGTVPVVLTTPGGTATAPNKFTYIPAPTISSTGLVPAAGPAGGGTPITITGTNLSGTSSVTFGPNAATDVTVVSPTVVTAVSPAGTGSVTVTLTAPGGTAVAPTQFTYLPAPTGVTISPDVGSTGGGTQVTIEGLNLTGASAVSFGSAVGTSVTQVSGTSITAISPPGSGSVIVTVTTPGGTALAAPEFTYVPGPSVSALTPARGQATGGTAVTITGSGLAGTTAVQFGTTSAQFTDVTATSLIAYAPPGTGKVPVVITTPGGTATASGGYTYIGAPAITKLSPSAGPVTGGTTVTITGTGLSGATAVTFGGVSATGLSHSTATSLSVVTPAGTGTVAVTVTTAGGLTTSPIEFTYVAAPAVTGISPATGPATGGTTIKITGKDLSSTTAVHFGSVAARFGFVTTDSLEAIAPAGSGRVEVSVTTRGGKATSPVTFLYAPLPPVPAASGYWMVASNGAVYCFGQAPFLGSMAGHRLSAPVVAMAATPDHLGYWLFASDGGVFAFGNARFYGSVPQALGPHHSLRAPIVAVEATPDGHGYRMFAADGGVFDFGDAHYVGSLPGLHTTPNKPIVAAASTPVGQGYWLVGGDGGIYAFPSASFEGSLGDRRLQTAIVDMAPASSGRGYWIFGAGGEVWNFGDAHFFGDPNHPPSPVVGGVATATGGGYWLITRNGAVLDYGDAAALGSLQSRHIDADDIVGGIGF
jgi:hypothetical protein